MTVLMKADKVRVEFGPLVAVNDISFELHGGELLGLVGPNGAGKTTLLRVLAGLLPPTRGAAEILGRPVLGESEVVRHHIGFAPDTPPAYEDITVNQFLRFIAGAYGLEDGEVEERLEFWLEHLWLTDKRDTPIKHLSRGMRQRVTLARTFLPKPHAILLDEPLAGLDPAGRMELRRVLSMLRDQGCAMIVSSHILADLEEVATHIAIIEHGSFLRWETADSMHVGTEGKNTFRVETLDGDARVVAILDGIEGLSDIQRDGNVYTFDYRADGAAKADLLRKLVLAEVSVVSFTQERTSLEDIYLRSGVKQVD
jgi:ABC-2 type transport system ATP-binding protein